MSRAADAGGSTPLSAKISLGKTLRLGNDSSVALLWAITLFLTGMGLIMVLSASSITSFTQDQGFLGMFWRQALYAAMGLPLMIFAATRRIDFWKRYAWVFFGAGIVLQLLVFTPLGFEDGGNRNWISLGPINGQPSEPLKLALVVWIGAMLLRKERHVGNMAQELVPVVFPGAMLALGLVVAGKDLGTAMVMGALVIGAMFFGGVSWKSLGVTILGGLVGVALLVVTSPNRMERILGHASSTEDYTGTDWQPLHGLWALANGGVFGVGLGGSKAKWNWLPAAENDYIFAVIGEELGFIGAMLVIVLFIVLAIVMLRVITRARDRFGRAVVGGALVWIVGQAFMNIGVVIRIFPVIGVPLPLISSGGTSLISCLITMGVVISIARDAAEYRAGIATEGGSVRAGSRSAVR